MGEIDFRGKRIFLFLPIVTRRPTKSTSLLVVGTTFNNTRPRRGLSGLLHCHDDTWDIYCTVQVLALLALFISSGTGDGFSWTKSIQTHKVHRSRGHGDWFPLPIPLAAPRHHVIRVSSLFAVAPVDSRWANIKALSRPLEMERHDFRGWQGLLRVLLAQSHKRRYNVSCGNIADGQKIACSQTAPDWKSFAFASTTQFSTFLLYYTLKCKPKHLLERWVFWCNLWICLTGTYSPMPHLRVSP